MPLSKVLLCLPRCFHAAGTGAYRVTEHAQARKQYLHDQQTEQHAERVQVDSAGIDILLVGDSVAMVVHGHDTTLPVTMDDMLVHCKAVSRGARR